MRRRVIKNQTTPVRCAYCKKKKANHTLHGWPYNGKTCCDDCYNMLKGAAELQTNLNTSREVLQASRDYEESEGERLAYHMYGVY